MAATARLTQQHIARLAGVSQATVSLVLNGNAASQARIPAETGRPVPALSPAMAGQLAAHPLAGNVRELENLLHRAVALSNGEELQVDLAVAAPPAPPAPASGAGPVPPRLWTARARSKPI